MDKIIKILIGIMLVFFQLYYLMPNYVVIILKIFLPLLIIATFYAFNRHKSIKNIGVIIWLTLFFFVGLISVFYSSAKLESLDILVSLISTMLTLFVISQFISSEDDINYVIKSLIIGGMIYTLYIVVMQGPSILDGINPVYAGGTGMLFSYILTPTIIYVSWKIIYGEKHKLLYCTAFSILYFVSLMSGGKKAFLIPILFLTLLIILKYKKNLLKITISIILLSLMSYYLFDFAMNNPRIYQILGIRIQSFLNYFTQEGRVDGSTRERALLISESWKVFKENPFFGVGIGSFKEFSSLGLYSHNNYLELLSGVGLTGFIIYYIPYLILIPLLIKNSFKLNNKYNDLFLAFLLINLIQDVGTVSYYRTTFLIPICLSICFINLNKNVKEESELNEKYLYSK